MSRLGSKPRNKKKKKKKRHEESRPSHPVQSQRTRPQTTSVRKSQRQIAEKATKAQKLRDMSETEDEDPLIIPRK